MEKNHNEKGMSIIDIIELIWKHRVMVVLITIITAIVLVVPLYFVNKPNRLVNIGFEYNFLGVDEGRYPDGTLFDFRNLVSENAFATVAASDERFKDLDTKEMFLDENTRITRQEDVLSSERQIIFSKNRYKLSIPLKYFNYDDQLATLFVSKLINQPITYALSSYDAIKVFNNITIITDDVEFIDAINYYEDQYKVLIEAYENFIEQNGQVQIGSSSIANDLINFKSEMMQMNSFNEFILLVKQEKYIKNFERFRTVTLLRVNAINELILHNNTKINELENMFSSLVATTNLQQAEGLLSNIISLRLANLDLIKEKNDYQEMLDFIQSHPGNSYTTPSFISMVHNMENTLTKYTNRFNSFQTSFYVNKTNVIYDQGSIILIDGGMSNIVLALISGVFGLSLALVVLFVREGMKHPTWQRIFNNGHKESE